MVGTREVRVCSRCLGAICGEFLALLGLLLLKPQANAVFYGATCLALILAYADWLMTRNGLTKSSNPTRLISGLFLGFGGAALIYMVLINCTNPVPYAIGLAFVSIAFLVKGTGELKLGTGPEKT